MITKTWNIGESCVGGVITVEINDTVVDVICKDWDFKAGTLRTSDQSNAEERHRITVDMIKHNATSEIDDYLYELTSSYYASQIQDWIKKTLKTATA